MFAVLALIVVFTILGVGGLLLASKDSGAAGAIIDIKSRESAAHAGLMTAIGRFQASTANSVTQLNAFISSPTATKAKWLNFSDANTPVIATSTDPGYTTVAAGTDGSAFRVEIVGIQQATPPTIILRSWGRGRDGDIQVAYGTYRIEGLGLLMNAAPIFTPNHALYLNGDFGNANMGTSINGNAFISGGMSLNSTANPFIINGNLRMGGSLRLDSRIQVMGNAYIGGGLGANAGANGSTFQQNLVIGGGIGATLNNNGTPNYFGIVSGDTIRVLGNLNIYGTSWVSPSSFTAGSFIVGTPAAPKQFWVRDLVYKTDGNDSIYGNAYFFGLQSDQSNNKRRVVTGNLEIAQQHPTPAINTGAAATINFLGGNFSIGGSLYALPTVAGRYLDIRGGGTKTVTGTSYIAGKLTTSSNPSATFSQDLHIGNCFAEAAAATSGSITASRDVYVNCANQATYASPAINPLRAGRNIDMYGGVAAGFGLGSAEWKVAHTDASGKWTYRNSAALAWENSRVAGSTGVGAYQGSSGTMPVPIAAPTAANWYYATHPAGVMEFTNPIMLAQDSHTVLNEGTNREIGISDTSSAVATNTTSWRTNTNVRSICPGWPTVTGTCLNSLFASALIPKLNGYMILDFDRPIPYGNAQYTANADPVGFAGFTGKALFIVRAPINVNGAWPVSASPTAIQMIWVRAGGALGNFGFRNGQIATTANPCNFFGYIRYDTTSGTAAAPTNWQMALGTGCTINGSIHFANNALAPSYITPNTGNLSIAMNGTVFGDIAQNLGILTQPGGGAVIVPAPPSGLQAWENRIRFRRISELR